MTARIWVAILLLLVVSGRVIVSQSTSGWLERPDGVQAPSQGVGRRF
jgi:hypothetical protein